MNDRLNTIGQSAIAAIRDPAPALFLHCALFLRGNRMVSDETFRLISFQGQESASEPFEYQLQLHGNTSLHHGGEFNFSEIIGRPVTVGIQYPSDYTQSEMSERFQRAIRGGDVGQELSLFNGIVTSFSMEIDGVYRVTMKPAVWKLTLTNHYRIHAQKNIRAAIAGVLSEHRIEFSMDAVSGADNPAVARIQDWLQAGESDFDFIKRMMGKAHLYYYFTHSGNSHKMVFANRPAYPHVFAGGQPLRYTFSGTDEVGLAQSDVISQYSYQHSLTSSGVNGVFTRQEAAWEADPVAQFDSYQASDVQDTGELPFRQYKIYQYGCSSEEVRHFTNATSDAMETAGCQFSGNSFCAHFRAGHQFSLTGSKLDNSHPETVRPTLEGQAFVLTMVKHTASADGGYSNEFQSTEAHGFIAAFSMQETQQGTILAKVVAIGGDAPPPDWRYYKAVPPFDPESEIISDTAGEQTQLKAIGVYVVFSTGDEDSGPVWVKLSPGMQTVPEIGVTVVVCRAQDESELPEIQSIIQSNGSTVIMPSTWTANTHVGSSYSTSYGDGKSIRYGRNSQADLPNAINIVTTPYDSGLYGNTSFSQGAGYSFSTAESVATDSAPNYPELYGPYAGAGDLLSASESFGSNYSRQYAQVTSSFSKIGTSYSNSTIGKSDSVSNIDQSISESHIKMQNITSTMGTSVSVDKTGSTTSTQTIDTQTSTQTIGVSNSVSTITQSTSESNITSQNNTTTIGSSVSVDNTGSSTSTQTIGNQTSNQTIGVTTSTSITGVSSSNSVTGVSSNNSVTGVSSSISAAGVSSSISATGVSSNVSATGASSSVSATGASLSVNVTGSSTSVNVIGTNNTIDMIGPGFKFSNQALQPWIEDIDLRLTMVTILQIYL